MTVRSILPGSDAGVSRTALRSPAEAHVRLDRLAAVDDEHKTPALTFLCGFAPDVFDAVLDATEPFTSYDPGEDAEPFCVSCGASVGVLESRGDSWQHYTGDGITAKAQPYDAGHQPVIGWRTPADVTRR